MSRLCAHVCYCVRDLSVNNKIGLFKKFHSGPTFFHSFRSACAGSEKAKGTALLLKMVYALSLNCLFIVSISFLYHLSTEVVKTQEVRKQLNMPHPPLLRIKVVMVTGASTCCYGLGRRDDDVPEAAE